jgi:hypothetical protein
MPRNTYIPGGFRRATSVSGECTRKGCRVLDAVTGDGSRDLVASHVEPLRSIAGGRVRIVRHDSTWRTLKHS